MPAPWLAIGVVFLLGFRIGLNVTDSNVIDVGYAGVIGAQRVAHDEPLYGSFPSNNEHGDTYGPVNYEAYVPFEQIFGWSGTWDDLPAAHAAAIFFDVLATALMFLLGRRMRGPTLGIALAYAWVAYPFTLFALESNSNDTLVAVLVLAALLAASYRSKFAPAARGVFAALAGLAKFAPLALAPRARHARAVGAWAGGLLIARPRAGDVRARLRRNRRARVDPRAQPRLPAHDLPAHDRIPVQPRLAVLGLGAVRVARAGARRRDRRARARAAAGGDPAPRRSGRPGGGLRAR